MKTKRTVSLIFISLFLLSGCGSNLFESLADEDSVEACKYQASIDLDDGNYDSVLNSSCADELQMGAAYFGKAGFDVKDVINGLSESSGQSNPLGGYVNSLVTAVDEDDLNNLDNSANEYDKISPSDNSYRDAQFYMALARTIKGLALIKLVIDFDGDGELSDCDINGNSKRDDADAVACTLLAAAGQTCASVGASSASTPTDITIAGKSGTYKGITVTITGVPTASCPVDYKKLHYKSGLNYRVAVITSETCQEGSPDPLRTWPCPVESDGTSLDLVTAFDQAISDGVESLNNSFDTGTDILDSVQDIKNDACGGDICTSDEIANYITTQL
jgi:hypothetical protein